ncbi:DUF4158 domain-containing protein [Streptomyces sp. NBC_01384]|uniref:DUF4158 domain-containing protein n=1 Tax=Streptomyces sp. NBC_01384 TaxID=2903847 RepID=UPI0038708FE5
MDHFTLSSDESGWLRNKTGATRLGFAVQLKFLTWRGLPRMRLELPPDAVENVAKQVDVAASELAFYDFTSRAAKRHRSELRDLTGWHECTKTDQVKLVSHLVDVIWHDERREEQVRAELLRHAPGRRAHRRRGRRPPRAGEGLHPPPGRAGLHRPVCSVRRPDGALVPPATPRREPPSPRRSARRAVPEHRTLRSA